MAGNIKLFNRPLSLVLITFYKGLVGLFEIFVGMLILVFSFLPNFSYLVQFVQKFIIKELQEDPHDLFVNWLLTQNFHINYKTIVHVAWFLILLGVLKLVLAFGVWFKSMFIRDWALVFLAGVLLFGVYNLVKDFSFVKFIALVIELGVVYYLWKIFPRQVRQTGPV